MKKKVFAYLHTHWDREWYRDKEDFNIRLIDVLDTAIDEILKNKAPFFYLDGQTSLILDYLKYRQDKKETIKSLIKQKKLALGPYFVSADSYLISYNSMLKNLELGMKDAKELGQKDFIGYMADIFGVSRAAFMALDAKNIDKAIIWRGVNPEKLNNNCNFLYNSIKTHWLSQGYFNDFCHNDNIEGLEKYLDKISKYSDNLILLPIGADHLGILKDANNKIKKINKKLNNYEIILTSPFEYFKKANFKNKTKEEEFLDNSNTYILQGCYSSRIYQKIKNVYVQNKISKIVEPLNKILKTGYDKNIEIIYRTFLKNHAHDGICACSVDSVHKAIDTRYDKCIQALNSIQNAILYKFKKKYQTKQSKNKIGIFNLSNYPLNNFCLTLPYILENAQVISTKKGFARELLDDCYKIPVTEDICNLYTQVIETENIDKMSFKTLKIKKPKKTVYTGKNKIENNYIKFENMKITDKKKGQTLKIKLTDIKDEGDCYNFCPKGKYVELKPLKTEVLYDGNIQSAIRVHFKNIKLDITLNNKNKFLLFNADIENKTKNHKLQMSFVFDEPIKKTTANDSYGIISREHNPNYDIRKFMPAKNGIELKTNTYPMQNFVSFKNAIVMTKGLHEYEIYKNELRICLLRSIGIISNPKNKTRAIPAGPPLIVEEAQCMGKNSASFIIAFDNNRNVFEYLDNFYENYATIEGEYEKELTYNSIK